MGKITLILGGARSGKSTFAKKIADKEFEEKIFLATAEPLDAMMEAKIKRHQNERNNSWKTIECYKEFKKLNKNFYFQKANIILIDCITFLVANQMRDSKIHWDLINQENIKEIELLEINITKSIKELLKICKNKTIIIVSNEVGLGIVPENMFANYYRDILGRINQLLAREANVVYFLIAGIPLKIKGD